MKQILKFKELFEKCSNERFKNYKEIMDFCQLKSSKLNDIWFNSNKTDYSVYEHNDYIYDMFICYGFYSSAAIRYMIKYFKENISNWKDLTYFDDYNGIGLTTLHLLNEELKSYYFNDNKIQLNTFKKLCESYKFDIPILDKNKKNIYDVYISLEIIEHYKEPLKYLKEATNRIKDNGYLIYTTTFNPLFLGHHHEYIIDGKIYLPKKTNRIVNSYLRENFELLFRGFNGLPKIYKKK